MMIRKRHLPGAALFIVIAVFSACSHKTAAPEQTKGQKAMNQLKSVIERTVKDPERISRIKLLIDKMDHQAVELNRLDRMFTDKIRALSANKEAKQEDLDKLMQSYKPQRDAVHDDILDTLVQIRALTTSEEWKSIAAEEKKAFIQHPAENNGG